MSTTPGQYLIEFNRGDRVYRGFRVKLTDGTYLDLTDYTFALSVRKDHNQSATPLFDLTAYLTADLGESRVKLDVPDTVTATMEPGKYWWGLVYTDPLGNNRTYIEGNWIVRPRVTVVV